MRVLKLGTQDERGSGGRARILKPIAAVVLAAAMTLSVSSIAAQADEPIDLDSLAPRPAADPDSPTGSGHGRASCTTTPNATSVGSWRSILLRDWDNLTATTVYQPSQYRPGLMRGGGGYDVQMTKRR